MAPGEPQQTPPKSALISELDRPSSPSPHAIKSNLWPLLLTLGGNMCAERKVVTAMGLHRWCRSESKAGQGSPPVPLGWPGTMELLAGVQECLRSAWLHGQRVPLLDFRYEGLPRFHPFHCLPFRSPAILEMVWAWGGLHRWGATVGVGRCRRTGLGWGKKCVDR